MVNLKSESIKSERIKSVSQNNIKKVKVLVDYEVPRLLIGTKDLVDPNSYIVLSLVGHRLYARVGSQVPVGPSLWENDDEYGSSSEEIREFFHEMALDISTNSESEWPLKADELLEILMRYGFSRIQ